MLYAVLTARRSAMTAKASATSPAGTRTRALFMTPHRGGVAGVGALISLPEPLQERAQPQQADERHADHEREPHRLGRGERKERVARVGLPREGRGRRLGGR